MPDTEVKPAQAEPDQLDILGCKPAAVLVLTAVDPGPVFEAFAGFLTGAKGCRQNHAADRVPTPEAQAQPLHLLVDDPFFARHQCATVGAAACRAPRVAHRVELANNPPCQTHLKRVAG